MTKLGLPEVEGYQKLLEPDVRSKVARSLWVLTCRLQLTSMQPILTIMGFCVRTQLRFHADYIKQVPSRQIRYSIYIVCCILAALSIAVLFMSLCQMATLQSQVQVASGSLETSWPDPPPHDQVARVARYIVHISEWASIATFSVSPTIEGYPFANILSLSDGPIEKSTGTPYMYLTPMDLTSHDLAKDNRASLSMSEAQSNYCHKNNFDPESPLCARILMTGHIVKVEEGSDEEVFARNAVFSRHPEMEDWPEGHHWFFAKMNVTHIYVLDFFGGASEVDIKDYYEANPF